MHDSTIPLGAILSNTPTWVWAIFALLIAVGLRQTRPQDLPARRVWVPPVIFGLLSIASALRAFAPAGEALVAIAWLAGAGLGLAANRVLALPRDVSLNADGSLRVGGSLAPLVVYVGIFLIRYVTNVALAMQPALSASACAAIGAGLAYGVTVGLLVGRARRIWSVRRPQPPLAAA